MIIVIDHSQLFLPTWKENGVLNVILILGISHPVIVACDGIGKVIMFAHECKISILTTKMSG